MENTNIYNNILKDRLVERIVDLDNKKAPIKKGCPNKQCFCTGKCQEIIGWRDKLPNEY